MGSQQVDARYMNSGIPAEIAENLKLFFPEHYDLEEVLLDQECVYQSLRTNNQIRASDHDQSNDRGLVSGEKGESSWNGSLESQIAIDEALARSLQLEDDFDNVGLSAPTGTVAGNSEVSSMESSEVTSRATSVTAVSQDNIDPDNMTYEELQSLTETVGTESKGLSEDLIASLPSYKHKTGYFSKKSKNLECVICHMAYQNREWLTTLPCNHEYHSKCITRWLEENKTCPVCMKEVSGS